MLADANKAQKNKMAAGVSSNDHSAIWLPRQDSNLRHARYTDPLFSQWSGLYHDPLLNYRRIQGASPRYFALQSKMAGVLPFGIVSEPSPAALFRKAKLRELGCGLPWPFGFRLPAIHPVFQPDLRPEAAIRSQRAALPAELLGKKSFTKPKRTRKIVSSFFGANPFKGCA